MLALPPFRGLTRQLVLLLAALGIVRMLLFALMPGLAGMIFDFLALIPNIALHGMVWQFGTYPFFTDNLLVLLFALLSVWFFGSALEEDQGSSWLGMYLLVATVGGGILAAVASKLIPGLDPGQAIWGPWPAVMAMLLAFARFNPRQRLNFNFIFKIEARWLAVCYLVFYLAEMFLLGHRAAGVIGLANALAGYLFLVASGRRGLRYAASERWFGVRNAYARAQRKRAAKRFQVYIRKHGREVEFDDDGRLIGQHNVERSERPGDDGRPRWTH